MSGFYVVHQNIQVFAGGPPNKAITGQIIYETMASNAERGGYGPAEPIGVLGFTEVCNANGGTQSSLTNIAASVFDDDALGFFIPCGQTATQVQNDINAHNNGKEKTSTEYIAIYTGSGFTPEYYGNVLKDNAGIWVATICAVAENEADGNDIQDDEYVPDGITVVDQPLPSGMSADCRGVCFVAGIYNNVRHLIGFAHNVYNIGSITTLAASLGGGYILSAIKAAFAKSAQPNYYNELTTIMFGGDWNTKPTANGTRGNMFLFFAADADDDPIQTTEYHEYDYWFYSTDNTENSNHFIEPESVDPYAVVKANGTTKAVPFSDHQAILAYIQS